MPYEDVFASWKEFCRDRDVMEEDPPDMPTPLGIGVRIQTCICRESSDPTITYEDIHVCECKKQNNVEPATFVAEVVVVAARVARNLTVALRITPPIDGPADVVKNIRIP
eukprot:scaffold776_cov102-Skeletonema_dohrnii-CCMP3373.AAC.2